MASRTAVRPAHSRIPPPPSSSSSSSAATSSLTDLNTMDQHPGNSGDSRDGPAKPVVLALRARALAPSHPASSALRDGRLDTHEALPKRPQKLSSSNIPHPRALYNRKQHQPAARPNKSRSARELLDAMPGHVLDLILGFLKSLHLARGSDSCATCWMRDLCSLCLASRKWHPHARAALYRDIQLVGPDSPAHKKRFKHAPGARILLLRRSLRSRPETARLVRSLKLPRPEPPPQNWSPAKATAWLDHYQDTVASLVCACPNLETLSGPISSYDHSFKRIFHALSTRRALNSMVWILDPLPPSSASASTSVSVSVSASASASTYSSYSSSSSLSSSSSSSLSSPRRPVPSSLTASQEDAFLHLHRGWTRLRRLSIYCRPGASLAPHTLLSRTLTCLPALQHLHLSNLAPNAFNDDNLVSLPPLRSLILSHTKGVTAAGLSALATLPASLALERLDLRHVLLTSLPALARLLSNLRRLTTLSFVQGFQPVMPETDSFALWMMPYLASPSLQKLHWDITSRGGVADDILVRSIAAGGFPCLRVLRAPNDPEGCFQALCRPTSQISLPSDRFIHRDGRDTISQSMPASPVYQSFPHHHTHHPHQQQQQHHHPPPLQKSSTMVSLPSQQSPPLLATDLLTARLAAQSRLEAALDRNPRIRVTVTDDDGRLAQSYAMAGYLGTLGSAIEYHLMPDAGATDASGGLLDVGDVVGDGGETLGAEMQGCEGAWNYREGVLADRREKERWWHVERGRWRRVDVDVDG